eukprot:360282-Chlamydomonas_euryale.AAC.10
MRLLCEPEAASGADPGAHDGSGRGGVGGDEEARLQLLLQEEEVLLLDVEVLRATYGDNDVALRCHPGTCGGFGSGEGASPAAVVHVQLRPHTGEDASCAFVSCSLALAAPHGYPCVDTPVGVALMGTKGMGDAREAELRTRLEDEARHMAGEMVLGHLCEVCVYECLHADV